MATPLDVALDYIARGWSPIPVPTRAKGPVIEGWRGLRIDRDSAPRFFDGTAQNIGVLTGPASRDLADVDLDTSEARKLAPAYLPATGSVFGRPGNPRSHWLYYATGIRRLEYRDKETRELLLELRGAGHQTVFPGSVHECGEPIEWAEDGEPAAGCAEGLKAAVGQLAAASLLLRCAPEKGRHDYLLMLAGVLVRALGEEAALEFLKPLAVVMISDRAGARTAAAEVERMVTGKAAMIAAGRPVPGWPRLVEELGRQRTDELSKWLGLVPERHPAEGLIAKVRAAAEAPPETEAPGGGPPPETGTRPRREPEDDADAVGRGADLFDTAHDSLALGMGAGWSGCARHVAMWGQWLLWTGAKWERDERLKTATAAREFLREKAAKVEAWADKTAAEATDERAAKKVLAWAKQESKTLRSAPTVMNVLGLARSNADLAASVAQWDADLWKLNTPAGLVDLRTGELLPADPLAYCTKSTAVAPAPAGARAPLWEAFLGRIFRHAPEIVPYLKKLMGFALTGLTTEHILVFSWGQGGNGKGVFFNTMTWLLGDYAAVAPSDLLLESKTDRHPTDMAMLRGARLVVAQELAPGRPWDEPKLKSLTGGDPVTARFMRQDFFTYQPQFLLCPVGNHKPSLRNVDEAIKRRLRLIPFLQNIPADERDPGLPERLKAEGPAILRWAVDGCLAWQRDGLAPPPSVVAATDEYLSSEDDLGQWLDERCVVDPKLEKTKASALFADWKEWREAGGLSGGSVKAFSKRLGERGFTSRKSNGVIVYNGLGLAPTGNPDDTASPASGDGTATDPNGGNARPSADREDKEDRPLSAVCTHARPRTRAPTHPRITPDNVETSLSSLESAGDAPDLFGAASSPAAVVPGEITYRVITDGGVARRLVAALAGRGVPVGLDLETTGLDPLTAEARLLQLAPADGPVTIVDLAKAGGLEAIAEPFGALRAVAHNATFDMGFLRRAGVRLVPDCTLLAGHVLTGKAEKLAVLAERHLGLHLDKAEQTSDWSGELSEEQLRYAALDAAAVGALLPVLRERLAAEGGTRAYELMRGAQPAIVAMELAGMPFDAAAQAGLLERLTAERDRLAAALAEALAGRNPNSGEQLSDWLAWALGGKGSAGWAAWPKTGTGKALATGASALKRGAALLPDDKARVVRELLLPFKIVEKRLSAFGTNLAAHVHPATGRIHADFRIAATIAGRMACSRPNLQQVPRDREFRALFRAPEGRAFAIADYSQVELRVAAMLAGETRLLAAFREGRDTHALTAGMLLGKPAAEVTKAERQLAKAVNFGLLYGQGPKSLQAYASNSYGVEIALEEATQHREAWFDAYPAFRRWHAKSKREGERNLRVRTPSGRVRRWGTADRGDPACWKLTEALNTPVQGGAAEVMLAALGHLTERLESAGLDAVPVAVVHDEVIVEAAEGDAPEAARLVEEGMVAGMLDVFPEAATNGLVEARVGGSWADK